MSCWGADGGAAGGADGGADGECRRVLEAGCRGRIALVCSVNSPRNCYGSCSIRGSVVSHGLCCAWKSRIILRRREELASTPSFGSAVRVRAKAELGLGIGSSLGS